MVISDSHRFQGSNLFTFPKLLARVFLRLWPQRGIANMRSVASQT
jgi:hypothetical protein